MVFALYGCYAAMSVYYTTMSVEEEAKKKKIEIIASGVFTANLARRRRTLLPPYKYTGMDATALLHYIILSALRRLRVAENCDRRHGRDKPRIRDNG
jgi:hypothetical protein